MGETVNVQKTRRPFLAGFWLIAAIPASILLVLPLTTIIQLDVDDSVGLIVIFLVHFGSGFMWAHSLGRRTGLADNTKMNIGAGIGFTVFVWGVRAAIVKFDPFISRWFGPFGGAVHLEFGALFVIWTGLAMAIGKGDLKLAVKLLGLVFLVVSFLMDLIGFRVGTPRADELPTMVITTLLGIWSAALVGTALFGKLLARTKT